MSDSKSFLMANQSLEGLSWRRGSGRVALRGRGANAVGRMT
jgi:hypothetical protein